MLTFPFKWQAWEYRLDWIQHCYVLWCYTAGMPTLPFNWHAWEYRLDQIQHWYGSENSFKLYLKLLSTSQPSSSRWRPLVVQQVLNFLSLILPWLSGCDCVLQFSENVNKNTHTKMVICTRFYSLSCFVLFLKPWKRHGTLPCVQLTISLPQSMLTYNAILY